MNFEGVLIDMLQRNSAVMSNSLHGIRTELIEIHKTLQIIGVQLKEMNEHIKECESENCKNEEN